MYTTHKNTKSTENLCFGATSTNVDKKVNLLNVTNIMTQLISTKNIH